MNSVQDTARAVGFPIRRSRGQRSLAPHPGLSQRATSFIASWRQGIHQMPFSRRSIRGEAEASPFLRKPVAHRGNRHLRHGTCRLILMKTLLPKDGRCGCQLTALKDPSRSHTYFSLHHVKERGPGRAEARPSKSVVPIRNGAKGAGGGGERDRTDDLLLAKQALSQLSYTPGRGSSPLAVSGS
jgi:hypothetical protein